MGSVCSEMHAGMDLQEFPPGDGSPLRPGAPPSPGRTDRHQRPPLLRHPTPRDYGNRVHDLPFPADDPVDRLNRQELPPGRPVDDPYRPQLLRLSPPPSRPRPAGPYNRPRLWNGPDRETDPRFEFVGHAGPRSRDGRDKPPHAPAFSRHPENLPDRRPPSSSREKPERARN